MLSVKQEAGNTNCKVIGLIRLGIKPKSTTPEVDAVTTRPSELFKSKLVESAEVFLCQMKVFYHRNSYFEQKLVQTLNYIL